MGRVGTVGRVGRVGREGTECCGSALLSTDYSARNYSARTTQHTLLSTRYSARTSEAGDVVLQVLEHIDVLLGQQVLAGGHHLYAERRARRTPREAPHRPPRRPPRRPAGRGRAQSGCRAGAGRVQGGCREGAGRVQGGCRAGVQSGCARATVRLAWPSLTKVGPRRKRPSRMNSAAAVLAALTSSSVMPFFALRAWAAPRDQARRDQARAQGEG